MNILIINSGSSSLKYQLIDMQGQMVLTAGIVERIAESTAVLRHQWRRSDGVMEKITRDVTAPDHRAAFLAIGMAMRETGVMDDVSRVEAIGHRVVHGGERFQAPVRIDTDVVNAIRELIPLAPLHNPANLLGIEVCLELFPAVPQVAVFDTAYHQTMPPQAYRYALPHNLYTDHAVRRYGFHGSSHAYVARRAAHYLGQSPAILNLITLHLGNGASAAAIAGGSSVDTSMGMTPLEGLVMGTRSGDIDPALVFYIGRVTGMESAAVEALLNRDSGLKGLCGSTDMREVLQRADANDASAKLALAIYCYRIKKYIGAYSAVLGRVDAVIFTAGIGENAPAVRACACAGLEALGIQLDAGKNANAKGDVAEVQAANARVKLLVIRTNEELEIAEQTRALLQTNSA